MPFSSFETMVELNPQLGRDLKVIARPAPFSNGLLCIRRGFYELVGPQLEEVTGSMHEKVTGEQLLTLFHADRLVPFEEGDLIDLEALVQQYANQGPPKGMLSGTEQ